MQISFYIRPVGQAVKTPPFHGGNMGSSPVRVTSKKAHQLRCAFLLCPYENGEEPIGFARGAIATTLSERSPLAEYRRYPYGSPKKENRKIPVLFFGFYRISYGTRGWEPFCESKTLCRRYPLSMIKFSAKDAIDNGGAGRAAKGESPVRVTSIRHLCSKSLHKCIKI